jgi:hypothetical protein
MTTGGLNWVALLPNLRPTCRDQFFAVSFRQPVSDPAVSKAATTRVVALIRPREPAMPFPLR